MSMASSLRSLRIFNVFLLLLFFGGLILDKFGIRFTGILSTVLMFGGALLKWYAVGHEFGGWVVVPFFGYLQYTGSDSCSWLCHLWRGLRDMRYHSEQGHCEMVYGS